MAVKPLLVDTSCPNCKKDHVMQLDPEDLALSIGKVHREPVSEYEALTGQFSELKKEIQELKAPKVAETVYPRFMPGKYCANGNCDAEGVHANEAYEAAAGKQCKNCDQLAPKHARKCAWCKKSDFDIVTEEDLRTAGIELPPIMREGHHHEH